MEQNSKITIGQKGTAQTTVTEKNTAIAAGSGSLEVFATPMMVALMESAACDALAGALDEGSTSVGTEICVSHIAASPLGMGITAEATVTAVNGRMVTFDISASDGAGEIGRGTHTRAIVDEARFMARVAEKQG